MPYAQNQNASRQAQSENASRQAKNENARREAQSENAKRERNAMLSISFDSQAAFLDSIRWTE